MVIKLKRHYRHKKKNRSFKIAYISALAGVSAIFLFLLIFTSLSMIIDFSEIVYRISAFVVLIVATFISGNIASFFYRRNGIRTGMISSIPVIAFALAISCLMGNKQTFFGVIRGIICGIAAGGIGGIKGVNSKMNIGKYKIINVFLHDT